MALLDSEIQRIKYELGYNVLTSSASPYVDYVSYFDQIVQPYTSSGAATTSTTTVTAASSPTPVTLTLASGTGFATGARVVIDEDDRQEVVTAQLVSSNSLTVLLQLAHTGTYRCTVEGGESIVREILKRIRDVKNELGSTFGSGSLKKVDEIEWYQSGGTSTAFGNLGDQLTFWRNELSSALGIASMWAYRQSGAQRCSVY